MRLLSTAVGKKEKYVSFTIHRLCFGIVTYIGALVGVDVGCYLILSADYNFEPRT